MSMRQLKISKSITNRESQSLEKYLQEIGKDIAELNAFIKQFEQMKDMMKMMNKMPMSKLAGLGKR